MTYRFFAPLVVASFVFACSAAICQTAPLPAQALTAAELVKVKAVLAPYTPATLTAEQAKLIKRSLRDAGMRRSPALDTALVAAGFSPAKLDALDPPPPRPAGDAPPPRPAGDMPAPPKK